jgi:SecD/SecF fusion protein
MRISVVGLALCLLSAPAFAAPSCGDIVHLSVQPAAKSQEVAAVLRRRLADAGVKGQVESEGDGLRAMLPASVDEALLTRPGRIEFRLVAQNADEAGAVVRTRWQGDGAESVEPEIILDERRLREFVAKADPNITDGAHNGAIQFHLDPTGMRNLMAASVEAIGRKLAILVDDKIVVDPIIRAPIASATGEISGGFSEASAVQLVKLLQSGRLPAQVTISAREKAPCAKR